MHIPFEELSTDVANLFRPFQSSCTASCLLSSVSSLRHEASLVALARTTGSLRVRILRVHAKCTRSSRTGEHHVSVRSVCTTRASSCSSRDSRPNVFSFFFLLPRYRLVTKLNCLQALSKDTSFTMFMSSRRKTCRSNLTGLLLLLNPSWISDSIIRVTVP